MRIFKILFNIIFSIFLTAIPKSKKYIVVGGWYGQRYADNSRYMYEYLCMHKKELGISRVFWHTKSERIRDELIKQEKDVLYGYGVRSIYWHLRSKVHIIDQNPSDILGFLSIRSIRINLWHGTPIKRFGYLENGLDQSKKYSGMIDMLASGGFWNNSYVVATSDLAGYLIGRAMNVPQNKILIASYPRTLKLYNKNLRKESKERLAFYLPTFRDNDSVNPILELNLYEIGRHLKEKNIKLVIKPHFADIANWDIGQNIDNIKILDALEDVYEWLDKTDLLITDYSSVYFDFLLTRRPVIFFIYDFEYYEKQDRGFVLPYDQFTPGEKVYTGEEMFRTLDYALEYTEEYMNRYRERYIQVLSMMHKYVDKADLTAIIDICNNR